MRLRASSASLTLAIITCTPAFATAGDSGVRLSKWFVMRQSHSVPVNPEFNPNVAVPMPVPQLRTGLEDLRNCGAQSGVSVMTILNFRRSTLSLQAGKHGEPTLRWSSRAMNHGEARRGLLDGVRDATPVDDLYRR